MRSCLADMTDGVCSVVDQKGKMSFMFTQFRSDDHMAIWQRDALNVPNFAICLLRSQ